MEITEDDLSLVLPSRASLNGVSFSQDEALSAIDAVLDDLKATQSLAKTDETISSLRGMANISSKSLAKLLHGAYGWWKATNQDEITNDSFVDRMVSKHGFKSKAVIERYILVWEEFERGYIPKREIDARPIKDLIPISNHIAQGYELGKKEWKEIDKKNSNGEILEYLRELKGKPARKNSLQMSVDRDGNIYAWENGERYFVGLLNFQERDVSAIARGISRILSVGISEK